MKTRRILVKILAGLFSLVILFGLAAWFFPQQVLTVDSGPVMADAMVVLGGGGPLSYSRPERALELFQTGTAPLIICSGLGDCNARKEYLADSGVPDADILLEPNSHSTRENAIFTIALLHARHLNRVIIVTSWYHSRRALACFEHYAPDIKFYSRPSYVGYSKTDWHTKRVNSFIRAEYLKLLGYWVCYGVCPVNPSWV
jgi:uncharacterized SAM-binding protein YcdF (DUF218 family)